MGTASPPGATWILGIHLNQQHKACMNPGARKEDLVGLALLPPWSVARL